MKLISVGLGLALVLGPVTSRASGSKDAAAQHTLATAPAAELPAKAADLVQAAKSKDRPFTTVHVVKAAIQLNPVSTTAVVGAIARAVPAMASIAAGTAAEDHTHPQFALGQVSSCALT